MSVIISGSTGITLPDSGALSTSIGDAINITSGYVSGIQLGGTGSANKLDDYEEGTWTPTGFTGGAIYNANYTKVGRLVTVNVYLAGVTFSSSQMYGLPFNADSGYTAGTLAYVNATNINSADANGTLIQLRNGTANTTPNGGNLMVSVTYHTNS